MPTERRAISDPVRSLFETGTVAGLTDAQLLERFRVRGGEAGGIAFEALVRRHGPMVLRVCRRVLGDPHDAQDAFQATFLVLVRRAHAIREARSLAPWLHGVALRVASCSRANAARRRKHERTAGASRAALAVDRDDGPELEAAVQEELGHLPERFRVPLVLCDLGGLTHEQAADRLACPVGTIKSRLARGRERLKGRLARRGVGPSAAIAAALDLGTAPAALAEAALRIATRAGAGGSSAAAAILAKGALKTMMVYQIKTLALFIISVAGVAGLVGATILAGADDPRVRPQTVSPSPLPEKPILDVLRKAARATASADNPAHLSTCLVIAKAQIRAGDKEGAIENLRRVSSEADALPASQRCSLLTALAWARDAAGDRAGGLEDFARAKDTAAGIGTVWGQVRALKLVAAGQLDLGDPEAAEATVNTMSDLALAITDENEKFGPVGDVVAALLSLGDFDRAFLTIEAAAAGNDYLKGQLLGRLAAAAGSHAIWFMQPRRPLSPREIRDRLPVLARIAEIAGAFAFAEERPDVDLAIAFAHLGDFDEAIRIAHRFGMGKIRYAHAIDMTAMPYILSVIAADQGKAGKGEAARRTIREALDLIEHDPKLASRRDQVAWAQAKIGDFEGASKTLEAGGKVDPRELADLAHRQELVGDREGSRATYRLALAEAERVLNEPPPEPKPGPATGVVLVDADGKVVEPPPGDPEARRKDQARQQVAAIQARMGDRDAAVATFLAIVQDDARGRAAGAIAEARARSGDAEGALAWALSLEPTSTKISALRGLAEGVEARDDDGS